MMRLLDQLTLEFILPAAMLALMFTAIGILLWRAQRRPDFDIANFLRDEHGKESAFRAFAFVALAVTSWLLAVLALRDKLTPDYFFYYCLTWANTVAAVKLAERWSGALPFTTPRPPSSYGGGYGGYGPYPGGPQPRYEPEDFQDERHPPTRVVRPPPRRP